MALVGGAQMLRVYSNNAKEKSNFAKGAFYCTQLNNDKSSRNGQSYVYLLLAVTPLDAQLELLC